MIKMLIGICVFLMQIFLASAGQPPDQATAIQKLREGQVGKVSIGMSMTNVESILQSTIAVDFMGDGRRGALLIESKDLNHLGVNYFGGSVVDAVELLFQLDRKEWVIGMISIKMGCDDVRRIFGDAGRVGFVDSDLGSSNHKFESPTNVWGVNETNECSFWTRRK